jgi:dUTP pyrophosphatase
VALSRRQGRVRSSATAPRKNRGTRPRANPRCPHCGTQYRNLKTGETFYSVSEGLWAEVQDGSRQRKTIHTVLGRWYEIKQHVWKQHLDYCEAEMQSRYFLYGGTVAQISDNPIRYVREAGEHQGNIFPPAPGDVGYDLAVKEHYVIYPGGRLKMSVGISVELPQGFWGDVRVRSSVGSRGVLLASSGVIDNGYRGVIQVPVINLSGETVVFEAGDRVAQLILMPIHDPGVELVGRLTTSERGVGGFGSTGR